MTRVSGYLSNSSFRACSETPLYSSSQLSLNSTLESFAQQARDGRSLVAMSTGSLAFSLTRSLGLSLCSRIFSSSALIQSSSWGLALLGEVAAFRGVNQALGSGESWRDAQGFSATLTDFICLKGIGHFLRSTNPLLRHFSQSTGMVAGELATEALHLRESSHENLAERFVHASVTTLAMEAGGHLTHIASGGRLRALESHLARNIPIASRDEEISPLPHKLPSMSMQLRLGHELRHELAMKLPDLFSSFAELYDKAEKRHYQKHGLDFEYAVLKRAQLPYVHHSPGLMFNGMAFVVEDSIMGPEITPEIQQRIVELIAVHEYGEAVFGDHHAASLLEFEVAKRENFLEQYLTLLETRCFLKFRDIALNRMGNELLATYEEKGMNFGDERREVEAYREAETESTQQAMRLRDAFLWPNHLRERYAHGLEEDVERGREIIEGWADRIVVNEQVGAHLGLAAQHTHEVATRFLQKKSFLDEALLQASAAFYGTFGNFFKECEAGTWSEEHFEPTVIQGAVSEAHQNLRQNLEVLIQNKISRDQQAQALQRVNDLSLLRRSFEEHREILKFEREHVEEEESIAKLQRPRPLRGKREVFWREAQALVFGDAAQEQSFREGYRREKAEREYRQDFLNALQRKFERPPYLSPSLLDWALSREVETALSEVAQENPNLFTALSDEVLQKLASQFIREERDQHTRQENRRKLLSIAELRRQYGPDLANYPAASTYQRNQNLLLHAIEVFDKEDSAYHPGIAAYIYDGWVGRWGRPKEPGKMRFILREAHEGNISNHLAFHLFEKEIGRAGPLKEEGPCVPALLECHRFLDSDIQTLFHYLFLRSDYVAAMDEYPLFYRMLPKAGDFTSEIFTDDLNESLRPNRFWSAVLGREKMRRVRAQQMDYAPLASAVLERGRRTVMGEIEAAFTERGIALPTLLSDLKSLQRSESFLSSRLQGNILREAGDGMRFDDENLERRIISKLVFWEDIAIICDPQAENLLSPNHPLLPRILQYIAQERQRNLLESFTKFSREDYRRIYWERFFRKACVTSDPLSFFQRLSKSSGKPVHELARVARLLLFHFFDFDHPSPNISGDILDLFENSGDGDLELAALFVRVKELDLRAMERLLQRGERDKIRHINLEPLGRNPEAIPILAKWGDDSSHQALRSLAEQGHLEALAALADLGISIPDLSIYQNRPEALPILEKLAKFDLRQRGALGILFFRREIFPPRPSLEVCPPEIRLRIDQLVQTNRKYYGWTPRALTELARLASRYDFAAEQLSEIDLSEREFYDCLKRKLYMRSEQSRQEIQILYQALEEAGHWSHLFALLQLLRNYSHERLGLEPLYQLLRIPGIKDPQSRVRRLLSYFDVGCFHERAPYSDVILSQLAPYHEGALRVFANLPLRKRKK